MEYIYKLVDLNERKKWNDTGVSESEITEMEQKFNISLPIAYREFLDYSGHDSAVILQGHGFEYLEEQQQEAQNWLKEYGLQGLIKKPFWVIATLDEAFWYFHLDEGDNPAIYRLDCEYYEEYPDKYSFGKVADSFQYWIEEAIENYEKDPYRNK